MTAMVVAKRVFLEIARDRRTLAFFMLVPVLVMTLVYFAIAEDEVARVGVLTRGAARLFEGDLLNALEQSDDITLERVAISDDVNDPNALQAAIIGQLERSEIDAVLLLDDTLLRDRFNGDPGQLHLYLEGSRPLRTAASLSGISSAMDELAAALPVIIDADCSSHCAESVNSLPMELNEIYRYGSEDLRTIDFFLPVLPAFFVFFLTFVISTIIFQRERARGTLERLFVAPVRFLSIILGYVLGFTGFATVQAAIVVGYCLALISFEVSGAQIASMAVIMLMLLIIALLTGLLASFVAANEFQALQFIPLVILPQLFLGDIIWDIEAFPWAFRMLSYAMPLTHANVAMRDVLLKGHDLWLAWPQLLTLAGFVLAVGIVLTVMGRLSRRWV